MRHALRRAMKNATQPRRLLMEAQGAGVLLMLRPQ